METLRYVVLVNGLLAVVSVAFYLLLRRETFFSANRLALWLGLASAVILPLIDLPDWRPQPVRSAMQRTAQVIVPKVLSEPYAPFPDVTITFPNLKTYRAFQAQQQRFVWSWQNGLILFYFLGVLLLLMRFVSQLLSLRKLIRKSIQEPYTDFTLVQGANIPSPFSFFSWVFVNPGQHTPDELDQILRHERVHVRERHSFDMIGAELVCIIFWYNPAAYLFRKLLQQTLEFSADRAVLAEGVDAKLYQYNLLKVSLAGGQSAITNHFNRSQLKSRISMLNRSKSTQLSWLKYPVLILAALTVASAFARPQLKELTKHIAKPVSDVLPRVKQSSKALVHAAIITTTKLSVEKNRQMEADALANVTASSEKPLSASNSIQATLKNDLIKSTIQEPTDHESEILTDAQADDKKMESLVLEGQRKYGYLGIGFRRFDKEEVKKQATPKSHLSINADSSLSVDNAVDFVKLFINNQPATPETIRQWKINQLYTVVSILGYDSATNKRSGITYLLFYVDKPNK
ncbi:M56 family metallopeptidase [Spirosoma fluviale]|uniref:BlaR1 peptidase M56 n=1 Tax=Spirosoma fluviale TaxID=1597977 RepID=A0A286FYD5_9BACT|nr:M56 family metallopeptidase [Spirosoma fluviale]SOD88301.1 BlaR1 peptidase M56 [Spirosoma fluviale]